MKQRSGVPLGSAADFKKQFLKRTSSETHTFLDKTTGHQLGENLDVSDCSKVILTARQRQAHMHILGGTGKGKSVFLEHLIRQDLTDRQMGLCLIDPHGSLYDGVLHYLARKRPDLADRVVLFNPAEPSDTVMGFNPLAQYAQDNPEYALNMMIASCLKAWGQDSTDKTPRITRWLGNIFATVIANDLTLVETAPLISARRHNPFRKKLLSAIQNDFVREDWDEFESSTTTQKQNYLEGAHNRLRKFLRNETLRNMFGVQSKTLDIPQIMAEKKILLVKLHTNTVIDRENTQLIGILLVNEFFRAALLRNPYEHPAPFYLYIDEFAQFVTREIAYALEECRKFGLFLTLAHQHLAQLKNEDEYLYASVLTNCQNRVVFGGLSYEDADIMSKEIHTGFEDLKQIKHHAWSTKFRPIEETRETRSTSEQHTEGFAKQYTDSYGTSQSQGKTQGESHQQSQASSQGRSQQIAQGTSATRGHSTAQQSGSSQSMTRGHMESQGTHQSTGQTKTAGTSHSNTEAKNQQQGVSSGTGEGGQIYPAYTASESKNQARSHTEGQSQGDTRAASESQSLTKSEGNTHTQGNSNSQSQGNTQSETRGESQSHQQSHTDTQGTQSTQTAGSSTGQSRGTSTSESTSKQHSEGKTEQSSSSHGETIATAPFHRMEEFQESVETFWSLNEIQHMNIGSMKNQATATALVRIGSAAPVRIQVDFVEPISYSPRYSEQHKHAFEQRVYASSPQYYLSQTEAYQEIQQRQIAVFDTVLRFDDRSGTREDEETPDDTSLIADPSQPSLFDDD